MRGDQFTSSRFLGCRSTSTRWHSIYAKTMIFDFLSGKREEPFSLL